MLHKMQEAGIPKWMEWMLLSPAKPRKGVEGKWEGGSQRGAVVGES